MDFNKVDKKTRYLSKINYLHNEYFYYKHEIDEKKHLFSKAVAELVNKSNEETEKREKKKEQEKKKQEINNKDESHNNTKKESNIEPKKKGKKIDLKHNVDFDKADTDYPFDIKRIINKLYYKISKFLHPDKTDDQIKIGFFKLCKKSRDDQLLYKLLLVAEKFDIDYSLEDNTYTLLDSEITDLENNIKSIQNNYILLWLKETDPIKKRNYLINYIKNQN